MTNHPTPGLWTPAALLLLLTTALPAHADREQWICSDPAGLFTYKQQQFFDDGTTCTTDKAWKVEEFKLYTTTATLMHVCGAPKPIQVGAVAFTIDKGNFVPIDVKQTSNGSTAHGHLSFQMGTNPNPSTPSNYMICRVSVAH